MCCSLSDDEMEEDMFKIGDYVAHYKEGVCQVVDIGKISLSCSDNEKEYYTLSQFMIKTERYIPRWRTRRTRFGKLLQNRKRRR